MITFVIMFLIGLGVASRIGGDAVGIYVGACILLAIIGSAVSVGERGPRE